MQRAWCANLHATSPTRGGPMLRTVTACVVSVAITIGVVAAATTSASTTPAPFSPACPSPGYGADETWGRCSRHRQPRSAAVLRGLGPPPVRARAEPDARPSPRRARKGSFDAPDYMFGLPARRVAQPLALRHLARRPARRREAPLLDRLVLGSGLQRWKLAGRPRRDKQHTSDARFDTRLRASARVGPARSCFVSMGGSSAPGGPLARSWPRRTSGSPRGSPTVRSPGSPSRWRHSSDPEILGPSVVRRGLRRGASLPRTLRQRRGFRPSSRPDLSLLVSAGRAGICDYGAFDTAAPRKGAPGRSNRSR